MDFIEASSKSVTFFRGQYLSNVVAYVRFYTGSHIVTMPQNVQKYIAGIEKFGLLGRCVLRRAEMGDLTQVYHHRV